MVLIVDDDEDTLLTLRMALEFENYSVVTACDGQEALQLLANSAPPGLILCDWNMPNLGGEGFLIEKAKDIRFANIPVVICCAALSKPPALALGAVGVLAKPFSLKQLAQMVAQHYRAPA